MMLFTRSPSSLWRYAAGAATVLLLGSLAACDASTDSGASNVVDQQPDTEARIQALFDAIIDGVQLVEAADDVTKEAGPVDESTEPPSYVVSYEGCVAGFTAGSFCVAEGKHQMQIVAPELHIIRALDQTYLLEDFASMPGVQMSGSLATHVDVTIDTATQTTAVAGTAKGVLQISGELEGPVEVSLTIGGGRNYTASEATPITITGTLTYQGETYPVEGGFLRE